MDAEQVILSRQLPKTGQVTEYRTGDDGYYQAGWWLKRFIATNKTRFIAKTINGDDIVIDLATGLVWAADGSAAGCNNGGKFNWAAAHIYAAGLDFAGFTDWRVPNVNELLSIVNYAESDPSIYTAFFPNTLSLEYHTSTTYTVFDNEIWIVDFDAGWAYNVLKTAIKYLRCVRGGV